MSEIKSATEILIKFFIESILIVFGAIAFPFIALEKYKHSYGDVYILCLLTSLFFILIVILFEIWDQPHNSRSFIIVALLLLLMSILLPLAALKVDESLTGSYEDSSRFFWKVYIPFIIYNLAALVLVGFVRAFKKLKKQKNKTRLE